jgi:hypothetical protein
VAGTITWPPPASATPTRVTSSMWIGGAGVAMSSPHPAATPPATPTGGLPTAILTAHPARFLQCCGSGSSPATASDQPGRSIHPSLTSRVTAMRGRPWPRNWPGSPPPRSASATASCGSRPATSTTWSPPAPSTTSRSTRAPRGGGPLWAIGRGASPDASDPCLGPPSRPRASRPPTPAHQPRTRPGLTGPAPAGGPRGRQGEGVMATAAAGHEAG